MPYSRAMTQPPERKRAQQAAGTDVSVSLRTLVLIRWIAVSGQAATVLAVHFGFGFAFSIEGPLSAVAASAALNIVATLSHRAGARLGDRERGALSRL